VKFDKKMELIAIVVLAVVIIGEIAVYTASQDRYSTDIEFESDSFSYKISSKGAETYSILVMENGEVGAMTEIYVYFDGKYKSNYKEGVVPIGAKALDQKYYLEQLMKQLEYRGAVKVTMLDANELATVLSNDIADGNYSKGLVVVSGALPDTIYQGDQGDTIFGWMEKGGRLYWAGNLLGAFYSTEDDLHEVDGYQMLFFGAECLNTGDVDRAFSDVPGNDLRNSLSLMNNSVRYGIDAGMLASVKGNDKVLAFGYSEENYSSIVMTNYGKGMICVLGGDYSNDQRNDLAQVLSSQVCYCTELIETMTGKVVRGTVEGTYELQRTFENIAVYVYLGGYFPVHGGFFS